MNVLLNRSWLYVLWFAILISGCAVIGGYNAQSHQQVTALKAAHIKFIDTFTDGKDNVFEKVKLSSESEKIDLKFREAIEFSKSLSDDLRTSNLNLLKDLFQEDLDAIKRKGRLLTDIEAKTLSDPSADAYDRAIRGECARPGAKVCK